LSLALRQNLPKCRSLYIFPANTMFVRKPVPVQLSLPYSQTLGKPFCHSVSDRKKCSQ
jgi:hypothetical protein